MLCPRSFYLSVSRFTQTEELTPNHDWMLKILHLRQEGYVLPLFVFQQHISKLTKFDEFIWKGGMCDWQ